MAKVVGALKADKEPSSFQWVENGPFPTSVGMIRPRSCPSSGTWPVPHERGDDPMRDEAQAGREVRSPRAWG